MATVVSPPLPKDVKNSKMVEEVKEMIDEDPELFEKLAYK